MSSPTDQTESPSEDLIASDRVTFDEETGTYRTKFDGHARLPTEAVVYAVAEASRSDPLDLPPLHSVLDPDALNALFETGTNGRSRTGILVSFEYAGHHVIIEEHGTIVITPPAVGRQ